jgi:NADPH-dependent 2,4-dienoyl-CoA reductase/sulfur reductase-like enzyme
MEAAIVASQRGHDVTLWESSDSLGGQLKIASIPPGKKEIDNFTDYLIRQLKKAKVTVELSKPATATNIIEFSPDAVILTVGARPVTPNIKGIERKEVVFFDDILSGKADVGKKVIVSGGSFVGCETADFLAEKGKEVTIISGLPELAPEMWYPYADLLVQRLKDNGVQAFTGIKGREITDTGMEIIDQEGKQISLEADDIVIAAGSAGDKGLFESIKDKVPEIYEAGDCVEARRLQEATSEGAEAGLKI